MQRMHPPPLLPPLVAGGRYQLLEQLGRGGTATVYRALRRDLQIEVALKIVPIADADSVERFRREARAALTLDHPGCVRVLDHGRCLGGRAAYLAMELLGGSSLRQRLQDRGPMPVPAAMAIVAQLLDGLAHAHRRGIVHRDIKPENVLFGRRGDEQRPVLIDFGLAQPDGAAALTAAGLCFGSPSYVAPERLLGRPHRPASDVYAVGVVAYELLTAARPFRGDGPVAIARSALRGVAVPLRARAPHLSPTLAAFIERAMARDPAHRFADADTMAAALDRVRRRAALEDDVTIPWSAAR
jgi:serine/threonine-protein kinase